MGQSKKYVAELVVGDMVGDGQRLAAVGRGRGGAGEGGGGVGGLGAARAIAIRIRELDQCCADVPCMAVVKEYCESRYGGHLVY